MHLNENRPTRWLMIASSLLAASLMASNVLADGLPKLKTEVAYPNVKFDRPVALAYPQDGSNLLFVAEQHKATIQSFPDEKDTTDQKEFFKLPDPINRDNEEGLLGLTFHPKYKENGEFFVYYSARDTVNGKPERRSVVSRFKVSKDDPRKADPSTEQRVWVSAIDPASNHNGGCIEFGPDGYPVHLARRQRRGGRRDLQAPARTRPTGGARSCGSTSTTPPTAKPYGIPSPTTPGARRGEITPRWAPEVYCHRLAERLEVHVRPRGPGRSGRGTSARTCMRWFTSSRTAATTAGASSEGFHAIRTPPPPDQVEASQRRSPRPLVRVSPQHRPRPPTARTTARASPAATFTGARPCPNSVGVYVYGDFDSPAGSGASASQGRQGYR